MTYYDIAGYEPINNTDEEKVEALMNSMLENGWNGMPILVYGESLLTGSHRLEALRRIAYMVSTGELDDAEVLNQDIAEDVTDIVEANIAKREEEDGWAPDIDYADIGWLLEGSWVEEYKEEIEEW